MNKIRKLTGEEFEKEPEVPGKLFIVKYKQVGDVIIRQKTFQHKQDVRRIFDTPLNSEIEVYVKE